MREKNGRPTRARAVVLTMTVVVCGLLASAGAGAALRAAERAQAAERSDRAGAAVEAAVEDQLQQYLDAVQAAAAGLGAYPEPTADAFRRITQPISDQGLPGAQGMALVVAAGTDETAQTQRTWRGRGAGSLTLRPRAGVDEHLYAVLLRGLGGGTTVPAGLDVAVAPALTASVRTARDTARVTVSDAYVLLADAALPAARRQLSFAVTAAVQGPGGAVLGYLIMGVRGTDFMASTMRRAAAGTVGAELVTRSLTGEPVRVAAVDPPAAGRADREVVLRLGQRDWVLRTGSTAVVPVYARADLLSAAAGGLLSVVVGLLVYVQSSARRRAKEAVVAATAQARAAAGRAEEQAGLLHSVMNSIGDGVGVVDASGRFVLHNPALVDMLGEEAVGDVPPREWPTRVGAFRQDGVTPFPVEHLPLMRALAGQPQDNVPMVIRNEQHRDGVVLAVSTRPLDASGGHRGAVAIWHDITERTKADFDLAETTTRLQVELAQRRAAEAQLRVARDELAAQKAYLTQVLDSLEIAVLTCDGQGRIVHANRTARAALPTGPLTVLESAAHLDLTRLDGSVPEPAQMPLMRALSGAPADDELLTGPAERRRTVLAHGRPLRDESGQVTGAVVSTYDVTALREREADLAAFAGVVAHDLNSPLATIGGYAELLEDELAAVLPGPRGLEARHHLARVSSTVERMRQLIDDLLTYTAAGDAKLELRPVDLRSVVDDVVTGRLEGPAADIFVGPLPPVRADPGMMRQLVDNLLGNALKYTPPGQSARIDVTAAADGPGWVRLEVADRGIGIPDGQHDVIFTGFHRAHRDAGYAGTGLGLAICRRIAQRHGGVIGATDHPGGGAIFHVTLPAGADPVGPAVHARS